jgi:hypothetical protein
VDRLATGTDDRQGRGIFWLLLEIRALPQAFATRRLERVPTVIAPQHDVRISREALLQTNRRGSSPAPAVLTAVGWDLPRRQTLTSVVVQFLPAAENCDISREASSLDSRPSSGTRIHADEDSTPPRSPLTPTSVNRHDRSAHVADDLTASLLVTIIARGQPLDGRLRWLTGTTQKSP